MGGYICEWCNKEFSSNEIIHLKSESADKSEVVCYECFNELIASEAGIELDKVRLKIVSVIDSKGHTRRFNLIRKVFPVGICLEANEITENDADGYKIAVHGEINCDQQELLNKLMSKVKKHLSIQYIIEETFQGQKFRHIQNSKVVGRIEWDDQYDGRVPKLIIDGKVYSWDEFGEILMGNEGFQFKLEIFDMTDEVE